MSECTHHCESCKSGCHKQDAMAQKAPLGELSSVRRVIAVMSGKGGVGKSTVTALLAVLARRRGLRVGILDADITGPSVPRAFGLSERVSEGPDGYFPVRTKTGIEVMSVNLMLEREDTPVIWRGPVLAGLVERFWSGTVWDDLDLMLIDCPPGTGDVPMTVLSRLPVDGAVLVTSPQGLVSMIVEKAVHLCERAEVPVWGMAENFSYYVCPDCGEKHPVYGASSVQALAERHGVQATAKLPMSPKLTGAMDKGMCELFEGDWLDGLLEILLEGLEDDTQ